MIQDGLFLFPRGQSTLHFSNRSPSIDFQFLSILSLKIIQLLLDMDGNSKEEASRRVGANIIIDPNWDPSSSSSEDDGDRRKFSDLQEGLSAAKEGDVVYLEQGFYFREEVSSKS